MADNCKHIGAGWYSTGEGLSLLVCPVCGKVLSDEVHVDELGRILSARQHEVAVFNVPLTIPRKKPEPKGV